jgi:multidrug efflux pump subunit AcrA (membrane-fusion protein)
MRMIADTVNGPSSSPHQDASELWANLCLLAGFLRHLLRVDPTIGVSEMTERTGASWLVYVLGALCAGAIVAAVLLVGPASSSTATITRTATAAQGVVQSTVSGSGNLQAASQLNLGFKTSGTVTHIYVAQGQHVTQGQLIATLDPQSAEVTLEQAKASLQSAEANLAKEEETDGEGSSSGGSNGSGAGNASTASAAAVGYPSAARATSATGGPTQITQTAATSTAAAPPATTTPTTTVPSTTPANTTPATTTPAASTPSATSTPSQHSTSTTSNSSSRGTSTTREGKESSSGASSSKATISTATREANLASAKAAVRSDTLTVQSDEQAVQDTRLYAPESGTIVSLAGQVGEVVSGSGTTKASSTGSSSSSAASSTGAAGASATGRAATGSSAASTSGASSSSSFAVLSDLSSMQLVVALSESEIGSVKEGQIATVTVEALNGSKLSAHVREVALLSTSSSGAVSYDVTFQLDQLTAGLKIGMSATAEVVVKQAEGVNVPTSAISAGEVTVERGGKQVRQRVLTGLAGNTSTIILSGLHAGETVVLPAASTTSSSATNVLSKLGSRLGGAGAGGLGGAGGGAFFRGGG